MKNKSWRRVNKKRCGAKWKLLRKEKSINRSFTVFVQIVRLWSDEQGEWQVGHRRVQRHKGVYLQAAPRYRTCARMYTNMILHSPLRRQTIRSIVFERSIIYSCWISFRSTHQWQINDTWKIQEIVQLSYINDMIICNDHKDDITAMMNVIICYNTLPWRQSFSLIDMCTRPRINLRLTATQKSLA